MVHCVIAKRQECISTQVDQTNVHLQKIFPYSLGNFALVDISLSKRGIYQAEAACHAWQRGSCLLQANATASRPAITFFGKTFKYVRDTNMDVRVIYFLVGCCFYAVHAREWKKK